MKEVILFDPQPARAFGLQQLIASSPDFVFKACYQFLAPAAIFPGAILVLTDAFNEIDLLHFMRSGVEVNNIIMLCDRPDEAVRDKMARFGIQRVGNLALPLVGLLEQITATGSEEKIDTTSKAEEVPSRAVHLTAREREVLKLILEGVKNNEIAGKLGISKGAARMHLRNLHKKQALILV